MPQSWTLVIIFSARCNIYISLAQDVIYTSRAYATMSVSVCLSVTEVHGYIIANLHFKFLSQFSAHCGRGEGIIAGKSGGIICAMLATASPLVQLWHIAVD